ncbi:ornithine cyclodeaminase [Streptomyces sp. PRh5]|uniref:ornithine cyclodeaminase family protein n=1 Tax=Streptomyces sp. PRh5 TaxID=1158056 RepID=UPI00044D46BF|nr:ornithine cyclodeaminase family protein [Streptomyces sp. PRh5]EXU64832.1 ornithine cyclodeaminase [Streptomyces sp. PRh5]
MAKLRIISGDDVRRLFTADDARPAMAETMARFSAGDTYQHPRITVDPPQYGGMVLLMPAASATTPTLGIKLLSMFDRASERGLPSVQGLIILVDAVHGEPKAIIDGTVVTEIRTAAVTAVATDLLAPPDAEIMGIIGAGVQARGHLHALASVRPWKSVRVFSRTEERSRALEEWGRAHGTPVEVVGSSKEALADADVVCTATSSCSPVLMDDEVKRSGVHVNAIGAFGPTCRELPGELVARSRIFVDSREAVTREAGDLLVPLQEGLIEESAIVAEIGDVIAGRHPGRTEAGEVTLFETLGLPIQDVVACDLIYQRAVANGIGQEIPFP